MNNTEGILKGAVAAMEARIRAGLGWDAFQREIRRADTRRAWDRLAEVTGLTVNGRDLLAAFAFAFFTDDEDENNTENIVKGTALAWIHAPEVPETLAAYAAALAEWKVTDRAATLQRLAEMYWEYELAFDLTHTDLAPEERVYYAQELQVRQGELMRLMVKIDGGEFFRRFLPIAIPDEVAQGVYTVLERAFWNRIKGDLTGGVYDSLYPVLDELLDVVRRLAPRGWETRVAWFADVMDTEFIRARVGAGVGAGLDFDFWRGRCDAAMEMMIDLDSAEAEAEHRAWAVAHPVTGMEAAMDVLAYVLRRLSDIRRLKEAVFAENA